MKCRTYDANRLTLARSCEFVFSSALLILRRALLLMRNFLFWVSSRQILLFCDRQTFLSLVSPAERREAFAAILFLDTVSAYVSMSNIAKLLMYTNSGATRRAEPRAFSVHIHT